jgi:hypothetical protein
MVVLNWITVLQYLFAFAMEYFPAALCSRCFNKEEAVVHEFSSTASDNKKGHEHTTIQSSCNHNSSYYSTFPSTT